MDVARYGEHNRIILRVDSICQKYDKYDIDKQRELNAYDAFARLYATVEKNIQSSLSKSEMASKEKNRAVAVALNAEDCRTKGLLMDEVPKLRKLVQRKVNPFGDIYFFNHLNGFISRLRVSRMKTAIRNELVLSLVERIEAIPDGSVAAANQTEGTAIRSHQQIKFDATDGDLDSELFFKLKNQDEGLDIISDGLDTLKNLAQDMNEELDRQVPLMNEIDAKVDRATSDLKKY
ncbi:hypothetical protein L6164_019120 [Bauhinia variegata]|uniref:Uncharacterized protein n=1 Tax=Bauhinia variegata TaxID=167791 RepID=A0ACB9ND62_BAUVA|nr:hypothetical protein L6164_019120 [Bauhinia variegata]